MNVTDCAYQKSDLDKKRAVWYRAKLYSRAQEGLYTDRQKLHAEQIKQVLSVCYNTNLVYISFRKSFIAVKVAAPAGVVNSAILESMENYWQTQGIDKISTPQGIIYRVI